MAYPFGQQFRNLIDEVDIATSVSLSAAPGASTYAGAFNIEKLNSSNYSIWKRDARIVLFEKKLWKYVNLQNTEQWSDPSDIENAEHAYNCLWLLMTKSEQRHIQNISDPQEAWIRLQKVYEAHTPAK